MRPFLLGMTLLTASKMLDGDVASITGTLSWTGAAQGYQVRWRFGAEAWQEASVTDTSMDIPGLQVRPQVEIHDDEGKVGTVDLADEELRLVLDLAAPSTQVTAVDVSGASVRLTLASSGR